MTAKRCMASLAATRSERYHRPIGHGRTGQKHGHLWPQIDPPRRAGRRMVFTRPGSVGPLQERGEVLPNRTDRRVDAHPLAPCRKPTRDLDITTPNRAGDREEIDQCRVGLAVHGRRGQPHAQHTADLAIDLRATRVGHDPDVEFAGGGVGTEPSGRRGRGRHATWKSKKIQAGTFRVCPERQGTTRTSRKDPVSARFGCRH